jgi:hypothetical protein
MTTMPCRPVKWKNGCVPHSFTKAAYMHMCVRTHEGILSVFSQIQTAHNIGDSVNQWSCQSFRGNSHRVFPMNQQYRIPDP